MIKAKICLLGAFAVGKTSLVRQFVSRMFSEKYETTIGVRVDKKTLDLGGQEITLVLWDIAGEDEFEPLRPSYLRGLAGCLYVADGTRPDTLDVARSLRLRVDAQEGPRPAVLLLNKTDLESEWRIPESDVQALCAAGWEVFPTSAKTGAHVGEAFRRLAGKIMPSAPSIATEEIR